MDKAGELAKSGMWPRAGLSEARERRAAADGMAKKGGQ